MGENETRPVERLLDNRKIDGLILTRTLERDPLIPLLKARKVPFVAIGQPEDDQVLSVDHDQVGGCREMTSLLLMKGMKHIALLGGSMLYTVNQSRLEGFRQAYVKMGQKIDENLLFLELESDDLRMEAVQQAVERRGGLHPVHGRTAGTADAEYAQAAEPARAAGYLAGVAV